MASVLAVLLAVQAYATPTFLNRGLWLLQEGRSLEALICLDNAPASPERDFAIGVALSSLGRHDEAAAVYGALYVAKPDIRLLYDWSAALTDAGRDAESVARLALFACEPWDRQVAVEALDVIAETASPEELKEIRCRMPFSP